MKSSSIIGLFDSGVLSYNIGNEIIMDAVNGVIDELFPNDFIVRIPFEDIGTASRRYNVKAEVSFIGGTNVLTGDLRHGSQIDFNLHNALIMRNIVLLGCGWMQYQDKTPTKYTKWALNRVLSNKYIHSVRDSYTLNKCRELDLANHRFANTGCPTLWKLTPDHICGIPMVKSESVVFTITDYNRDIDRDKIMINQILSNYDKIFFFPQGTGDVDYIRNLGAMDKVTVIRPRLQVFDDLLSSGCDYVGTRLHAGIRALQKQARSFIIGIDNRSLEMAKDFKLPVLPQDEIYTLSEKINSEYQLHLEIQWADIALWKAQFNQL